MSERDASRGGMFEAAVPSTAGRGEGQSISAKCDECHNTVGIRHPAKVMRGALRGLRGMVCRACMDKRKAVPA